MAQIRYFAYVMCVYKFHVLANSMMQQCVTQNDVLWV